MKTKKEFYEENYLNLLNQAKADLEYMLRKVINQDDESHILFYEYGVSQPIYREDAHNDEMSETISGAWMTEDGKVGFTVDTFDSGYDIGMSDLDMDMVIYLLGEIEEINLVYYEGGYPFNEGDDYWVIEDNTIVWSCWDEISEQLFDSNRIYFTSFYDAEKYAEGMTLQRGTKDIHNYINPIKIIEIK